MEKKDDIINGYGAHHSHVSVELAKCSHFTTAGYFKTGWWWTAHMKDGTQKVIFLRDEINPVSLLNKFNMGQKSDGGKSG